MRALGKDPQTRETVPFDAADRRYVRALFDTVHAPLTAAGVDFFWLDWQQAEFTRSLPELRNLSWLNELYFSYAARGDHRGLSFSRWGGFGDHRHPIHFSGDASTTFDMLAFEVPYTAASSNSGLFFWSHDIGGHMGPRSDEAYARWCQFGSFSAALRSHSTRSPDLDRRPWTYAPWAAASMQRSFQLRARFFPYLYSSAWQAAQASLPLVRALYLEYPRSEAAHHQPQEYLFGDTLLVAPISEAGAGPRRLGRQVVWFPEGTYYDFFTGERFVGPVERLVAAPIDELPLYVRAGVPVPMQPFTPRPGSAPLTELVVRCYPGEDGQRASYTLHEDDGETRAYERGQFASTRLTCARAGDRFRVEVAATEGHYREQLAERSIVVELPATQAASAALVDGAPVVASYDEAELLNRVELGKRTVGRGVTVEITAESLGDEALRARAYSLRTGVAAEGSLAERVQRAWASAQGDAERLALLAAAGSGVFAKNEHVYGHASSSHFRMYEPPGAAPLQVSRTTRWFGGVQEVEQATLRHLGSVITQRSQLRFDFDREGIDLAPLAEARFSSVASSETTGIADRCVSGEPYDHRCEWSAGSQTRGAWVELRWNEPQRVNRMVLYDRIGERDQVLAGQLTFSDGSRMDTGPLPNRPSTGPLTVYFPRRTVSWVRFTVTAVSDTTRSAGLAEWAVYGP